MNAIPLARARFVPEPRTGPLALVLVPDPSDAATCQEVLHGIGFRTLIAREGDEALHQLQEHTADVLVVGQWEGRLDGLTLLRILGRERAQLVQASVAVRCGSRQMSGLLAQEGVTGFACGDLWPLELLDAIQQLQDAGVVPLGRPRAAELLHPLLAESPDNETQTPVLPTLVPGTSWGGRFTIERVLGRGATAFVYGARDQLLGNELALKVLARPDGGDHAAERFRREVRITREVIHPNVVRTFDFGIEQGSPWYTMEWLRGSTLERQIAHGPMPVGLALGVLAQAFSGLHAIHQASVVHRDIKPDNLHLSEGGRVRLMDFGISRRQGDESAITTDGVVLGSPLYMSPERLIGDSPATPAADIWALGVVGYELLTGFHPFPNDDLAAFMLAATTQRPRPPSDRRRELGARVDDIVLSALDRRPEHRLRDCERAARELRRLAIAHGCPTESLPR